MGTSVLKILVAEGRGQPNSRFFLCCVAPCWLKMLLPLDTGDSGCGVRILAATSRDSGCGCVDCSDAAVLHYGLFTPPGNIGSPAL